MLFSDDENAPHTAKKEVSQRKKERTVKLDFITTLKRRTSMSMRQATVSDVHAESDSVSPIRPMNPNTGFREPASLANVEII